MSENIDDKIREIRTRISAAQAKRTRAQVEKESAEKRLAEATEALAEEFGVKTTADAKAKLAELRERLSETISEAEAQLEAAGA